jgi:hypothetical protein
MYGKSFMEETVSKHTNDALKYHMSRTGGKEALDSSRNDMVYLILQRVEEYGLDFTNSARGCDEECERELEMEIEKEKEMEVEVPLMNPMSEKPRSISQPLLVEARLNYHLLLVLRSLACLLQSSLSQQLWQKSTGPRRFTAPIILLTLLFIKMVLLSTPSFVL